MTEPTHEYFDQVDADIRDVLDACWRLRENGYADEAVDALRLAFAATWTDGGAAIVRSLMLGRTELPVNPFHDSRRD